MKIGLHYNIKNFLVYLMFTGKNKQNKDVSDFTGEIYEKVQNKADSLTLSLSCVHCTKTKQNMAE